MVQDIISRFQVVTLNLDHSEWKVLILRIPDSYDAKIAKFCYLCTLWHVIQLKKHIFQPQGC